ncbi:ImmA/IrrE family metallo-endopeptidase [Clostridium culturomicium]|uniref:ImmA/IrrE family metallo-endopeptidase n=1 Tax=Clostridium culturomicium TaxID=1499683 RepID=UPI00058D6885|nr:ImmA/IrrE family metallo-endopeptidase [Clostridium culturomicium]
MTYEELMKEYQYIPIEELSLPASLKGLYLDGDIYIDNKLKTDREKRCVLAEEIGHYFKTIGNIIDTRKVENMKQEIIARNWAYEKLCPLSSIVQAYDKGISGRFELAEHLNVTEEFLLEAVEHYKAKYGTCYEVDKHLIYFEPCLAVLKMF